MPKQYTEKALQWFCKGEKNLSHWA